MPATAALLVAAMGLVAPLSAAAAKPHILMVVVGEAARRYH